MFGFLANLLDWCYRVWPNYAGMVLLFTLIVMVVITPFTIKGMRSAAEMSRLQPEMKKLQDQYKNDRIKQNEEMQALFKEHGVNPLGGCLPMLLPLPVFFIIFRLLERMNARRVGVFSPFVRLLRHQAGVPAGYVAPHYLAYKAHLTQAIIHSNGTLKAFGVDLAQDAVSHHGSVGKAIPYYALIVIMTISQYWQQKQINDRNPAAANANPQMKLTMQIFPAFYALISLRIPAAVVFYLLLSGLFRMAQNSISYRYDPVLARAAVPIGAEGGVIDVPSRPKGGAPPGRAPAGGGRKPAGGGRAPAGAGRAGGGGSGGGGSAGGSFMERLRAQAAEAKARADEAAKAKAQERAAAEEARKPAAGSVEPQGQEEPAAPAKGGGSNGARSPLSIRQSGRVTPKGPPGGGKQRRKGR